MLASAVTAERLPQETEELNQNVLWSDDVILIFTYMRSEITNSSSNPSSMWHPLWVLRKTSYPRKNEMIKTKRLKEILSDYSAIIDLFKQKCC